MPPKIKRWEKKLYGNQGYPDNYTDPSFLKDLKKNISIKQFTLKEAFLGSAQLNQEISIVTVFLIVFYLIYMEEITSEALLLKSIFATGLGYVIYWNNNLKWSTLKSDLQTVVVVLFFGYLFSPVLHKLTESISTDSIYTITFFTLFIHFITFDYGIEAFLVSKTISLNAAIFGSICLASRLSSSFNAFTLLVSSTVFFVLAPMFLNHFKYPYWLGPLILFNSLILYNISVSILLTYITVLVFINCVCPIIFIRMQTFKNTIHGPWDEAIVKDLTFD